MNWFKLWASLVTLLIIISSIGVCGRPPKERRSRKRKEKRQSTRGGVKSFDDVLPFVEEATGTVFTLEQRRETQRIIGKITKDIVDGKVREDLEHHIQALEKMLTAVTGFEIDLGMNVKNLIAPTITFENLKYAANLLHKVREGKMDIRAAMSEIKSFLKKGFDVDLMDETTKKEMLTLLESMDEMATSGNKDDFAWRALHVRIIFFLKKYDQKVKDIERNDIDRSSSAYKSMVDNSRKLYRIIYKWPKSDAEDLKRVKQLRSTVKKIENSGFMENYPSQELKKRMKQFEEQSINGYIDQGVLKAMSNIAMYNLFSNNEPLQIKGRGVKKKTRVKNGAPKVSREKGSKEDRSSKKATASKTGGGSKTILHKTVIKHKKGSKLRPHIGQKSQGKKNSQNRSVTVDNNNGAIGSKYGSKGNEDSNELNYVSGDKFKGTAGSKYDSKGKHDSNGMHDAGEKEKNGENLGSNKIENSKENSDSSEYSSSQEKKYFVNKLNSIDGLGPVEINGSNEVLHSDKKSNYRKAVSDKKSKKGSTKKKRPTSLKVPGSVSGERNEYEAGSTSEEDDDGEKFGSKEVLHSGKKSNYRKAVSGKISKKYSNKKKRPSSRKVPGSVSAERNEYEAGSTLEEDDGEHFGSKKVLHSRKKSNYRKGVSGKKYKKGSTKKKRPSSEKVPAGSTLGEDDNGLVKYQEPNAMKNSLKTPDYTKPGESQEKYGSGAASDEVTGPAEEEATSAEITDQAEEGVEEGAAEGSTEEHLGSKEGYARDETRSDEQSHDSKYKETLKNSAVSIDADVVQTQVSGTINSFDDIIPFVEATKGIEFSDEDKKVVQEFIASVKTGILQGLPKVEMTKIIVDLEDKLKQLTDYHIDILKIADDLYTPTETFELLKQLKSLIDRLAKVGGSESGVIILKIGDMIKKLKKSNMIEEEEKKEMSEIYNDIKKNGKIDDKGSKAYSTTISAVLKRFNQSVDQSPADITFATLNELRNLLRSIIQKVKNGNMEELVGDVDEMKSLILNLKKNGGLKDTEIQVLDKTLKTLKKSKKTNEEIDVPGLELIANYIEQLSTQNNIPYDGSADKKLGISDLAPMLLKLMNNYGTDDTDPHKLLPKIHKLILKLIEDQNIDDDVKNELKEHFTLLNGKYQKSEEIDLHELEILAALVEKISMLLSQPTGLMAALKGAQELLHPSQMFDVQIITQIKLIRRTDFDDMEELISLVKTMLDVAERGDTIDKFSVQRFIDAVSKTLKSRVGQESLYSSGAFATLDELVPHIENIAKKKIPKRVKKGINKLIAKLKTCAEKGAKFEISDDCTKIVNRIEMKLENATGTLIDLHSHIKDFLKFTFLKDSLEHLIPILKSALSADVKKIKPSDYADSIRYIHNSNNLENSLMMSDNDDDDDDEYQDDNDGNDKHQPQGASKRESGAMTVTLTLDDLVPYVEDTIGLTFNASDRAALDLMINMLKNEVEKATNENEIVEMANRIESKLMDITGYKIDIGSITENLVEPSGDKNTNYKESQHITYSNSIDALENTAPLNEDENITKLKKHRVKRFLDSREINMLAAKIKASSYDYPVESTFEFSDRQSDKSLSEDVIFYDAMFKDLPKKRFNQGYYEKISPLGYGDVNVFMDSDDLKLLADALDDTRSVTRTRKHVYNYKDSTETGDRYLVNIPYNKINGEIFNNNEQFSVIGEEGAVDYLYSDQLYDDENSEETYDNSILDYEKDSKVNKLTLNKKKLWNEIKGPVDWQGTIERNNPIDYLPYKVISNKKIVNTEKSEDDKNTNKTLKLKTERHRHNKKLEKNPVILEHSFNIHNVEYLIDKSIENVNNPEENKPIAELISSYDEVESKNEINNHQIDGTRNVHSSLYNEDDEKVKESAIDELKNNINSDDDEVEYSNKDIEKTQESVEYRYHESKETSKLNKHDEEAVSTYTSGENESIVDDSNEKKIDESKEDAESTADSKNEEVNSDSNEENKLKYSSKEDELFGNSNEAKFKSISEEDKIDESKSNESGLDDDNESEERSNTQSNSKEYMLNLSNESNEKEDINSNSNEKKLDLSNESEANGELIINSNDQEENNDYELVSMQNKDIEVDHLHPDNEDNQIYDGEDDYDDDHHHHRSVYVETGTDSRNNYSVSLEKGIKTMSDAIDEELISEEVVNYDQGYKTKYNLDKDGDIHTAKDLPKDKDELLNKSKKKISRNITPFKTGIDSEHVPETEKQIMVNVLPLNNNNTIKTVEISDTKTLSASNSNDTLSRNTGNTNLENEYDIVNKNGGPFKKIKKIISISSNPNQTSTHIENFFKTHTSNQQLNLSGNDNKTLLDLKYIPHGVIPTNSRTLTNQKHSSQNQQIIPIQVPSILELLSGSKTYTHNPLSEVYSEQSKESYSRNNSLGAKRSSVITKETQKSNGVIHNSKKTLAIVESLLDTPTDVEATKKQLKEFYNGIGKGEENIDDQTSKRDAKYFEEPKSDHEKDLTDKDDSAEEEYFSGEEDNNKQALGISYLDLQSLLKTFESLALEQNLGREAMNEVYQIKKMVPNIIENVHDEEERYQLILDIYSQINESVRLLTAKRPTDSGLKDFKTFITFVKALALHGIDKPLDAHSMLKNLSIVTLNDKLNRCLPEPLANGISQLQKVVWAILHIDTDFPDDQDMAKLKTDFKDIFDIATKTKNLIHDTDSYENCIKWRMSMSEIT